MEDVMKAKKMLEKANVPSCNLVAYCDSTAVAAFGCCTTASTPVRPSVIAWLDDCECEKKQEGKTPMTTNTERDYLARRLTEVHYELIHELTKTYNIGVYTGPRTYKELIDFITNNKYTLDTKRTTVVDAQVADEEYWATNAMEGIIWNGRGVEDRKTYDLAKKALEDAKVTARDVIMTSDAAAGLAAFNTFKTWTYTAPAVA